MYIRYSWKWLRCFLSNYLSDIILMRNRKKKCTAFIGQNETLTNNNSRYTTTGGLYLGFFFIITTGNRLIFNAVYIARGRNEGLYNIIKSFRKVIIIVIQFYVSIRSIIYICFPHTRTPLELFIYISYSP